MNIWIMIIGTVVSPFIAFLGFYIGLAGGISIGNEYLLSKFTGNLIRSGMYSLPLIWIFSVIILWIGFIIGLGNFLYYVIAVPVSFSIAYILLMTVIVWGNRWWNIPKKKERLI